MEPIPKWVSLAACANFSPAIIALDIYIGGLSCSLQPSICPYTKLPYCPILIRPNLDLRVGPRTAKIHRQYTERKLL